MTLVASISLGLRRCEWCYRKPPIFHRKEDYLDALKKAPPPPPPPPDLTGARRG